MDIRSVDRCAREVSHKTVDVWWLIRPEEMRDTTLGGYLEYVTEFEVAGGDEVERHSHASHEFYYILAGRGIMCIDNEERDVQVGDLVYIPPNAVHSMRPVSENAPIHCFSFAISKGDVDSLYK